MKNHTQYSEMAATSRRASSRLKLVLLGVLAPTALFALPVGTMMFVGPSGETASVAAGAGPALDCASPRNAWRPACRAAKSNPVRDADVTGSINEAPAPTGALDQKAKRRSVAGASATAQPDPSAANPAPTSPAQAASPPASPTRQSTAQANPEPARVEPNPPGGRDAGTWQDPIRPADLAQTPKAPASPSSPASQPASVQAEPAPAAQGKIVKPEAAQIAAPSQVAVPSADQARASEAKPDGASPKAPASAATPAAEAAPARKVNSAAVREVSKPVEEEEPVQRPLRRELRRAAQPAPALAVRATRRARVVAARSAEEPARPVRRRMRPGRVEEAAYVSRPEPAVSFRRAPRRLASTRRPAAPGGLQVSSVQTYYTSDGRRVVVNVPPRADLVRELAAYHAANFSGRRAAAASPWGGGWFGD